MSIITSALSCPINFIATGFRRMVTTSGSVTRYQMHQPTSNKNGIPYNIFRAMTAVGKKPHEHGRSFLNTHAEVYQRAFDETACFHIRKKSFLGLSFRRFESAIATNDEKNIKSVSFRSLKKIDPGLAESAVTPESAKEPIYATVLPKAQRCESKPVKYSEPAVFLEMFSEALDRLVNAEATDINVYLQKQGNELAQAKYSCMNYYKHRIFFEFASFIKALKIRPSVAVQCAAFISAKRTLNVQKKGSGDFVNFVKFMSKFDLQIGETEFKFSYLGGNASLYIPPDVLRPSASTVHESTKRWL